VRKSLRLQFGKFLQERRGDLTLRDFARKAGLSSSTLQRLEQGEQNVTLDTLERVLEKLKVSISEVFGK
jgi:transcriptional regulator with XRE-family HTH domain